jgi:hypothetical protein
MGFLDKIDRWERERPARERAQQQALEAEREQRDRQARQAKIEQEQRIEGAARQYIDDLLMMADLFTQLKRHGYSAEYFKKVSEFSFYNLDLVRYMRELYQFRDRKNLNQRQTDAQASLEQAIEMFGFPWERFVDRDGYEKIKLSRVQFFGDYDFTRPLEFSMGEPGLSERLFGMKRREPEEVGIGMKFYMHYQGTTEDGELGWGEKRVYVRIGISGATITGSSQRKVGLNNFRAFDDALEKAMSKHPIIHRPFVYRPPRDTNHCLPGSSLISTPDGERAVKDLMEGDVVWTVDVDGRKMKAALAQVVRRPAAKDHIVAHIALEDGRTLVVSPGHPTIDSRELGALKMGDVLDGARIRSLHVRPYTEQYTYDILPEGDTGAYWADGILIGSTLSG